MTGGPPAGGGRPRRSGASERARLPSSRWTAALCLLLALVPAGCGGDRDGGPARAAGDAEEAGAADTAAASERAGPDTTAVNRFLAYSAAESLVDLKLWAGYGGANSAWNFDGYYGGNATVVVPEGWRVEVTYQTLDANVPHSAAIVDTLAELPKSGSEVEVAFPGASTSSFVSGIPSTADPVEFSFRASEAGRYWILCGVPGHAVGGMWIWLEVSASAGAPDFRTDGG